MKPVIWRSCARRDAADAAEWHGRQAGYATGERFLTAVGTSLSHISLHPASGSSRYAMPMNLEGLRFWPVPDFPYLIFYIDRDTHVDVWRVLHAQRDIPAWMGHEGPHPA